MKLRIQVPEMGKIKFRRRFALWPTAMTTGEVVWLEWYIARYRFYRWVDGAGGTWELKERKRERP